MGARDGPVWDPPPHYNYANPLSCALLSYCQHPHCFCRPLPSCLCTMFAENTTAHHVGPRLPDEALGISHPCCTTHTGRQRQPSTIIPKKQANCINEYPATGGCWEGEEAKTSKCRVPAFGWRSKMQHQRQRGVPLEVWQTWAEGHLDAHAVPCDTGQSYRKVGVHLGVGGTGLEIGFMLTSLRVCVKPSWC